MPRKSDRAIPASQYMRTLASVHASVQYVRKAENGIGIWKFVIHHSRFRRPRHLHELLAF